MNELVAQRYTELADLTAEIGCRLRDELEKLGFDLQTVILLTPDAASYRLERDPSDGSHSLVGEWRDQRGNRCGQLSFHADGSFFVEQDVVRPHPRQRRWFVEAVTAWGRNGQIKSEARLLPMPE